MCYALAEECAINGAEVILVSGPVAIQIFHPEIHTVNVNTAEQMFSACLHHFPSCDAAILSAAVADFSPAITYNEKIKKGKKEMNIKLTPTTDIAYELGKKKNSNQLLAGFALETSNEIMNARKKLKKKNFDFIVLNSLRDAGAGFGTDTNKICIIDKNNIINKFELKSKAEVAQDIVEKLISLMT